MHHFLLRNLVKANYFSYYLFSWPSNQRNIGWSKLDKAM